MLRTKEVIGVSAVSRIATGTILAFPRRHRLVVVFPILSVLLPAEYK